MSREYINRISIKKDGVYISHKSSNDDMPYYVSKNDYLTKAYSENGVKGLDRAMMEICSDACVIRGNHKSILKYKYATQSNRYYDYYLEYWKITQDFPWEKSKQERDEYYEQIERPAFNKMLDGLCDLCAEYDKRLEKSQ